MSETEKRFAPKLVLLPGLDGTGRMFAPFVVAMADVKAELRVLPLPEDGPQDPDALATRLLPRIFDSDEAEGACNARPVILVAESFSGPVAACIAARRPWALRGVVFVATFAAPPRPLLLRLFSRIPARQLSLAFCVVPPAFACRRWCLGPDAPDALVARMRETLAVASPSAMSARLHALAKIDARRILRDIEVPCLVIRASEDKLVPATAAAGFGALPDAREVVIEGPHFLLQTRPEECARAILASMQRFEVASDRR